jgi:hypothetical protein
MPRRVFALAAVLALLVCVALCLLWVVSFFRVLKHGFGPHGAAWEVVCRTGIVRIDNEPQHESEMHQSAARWESEHGRLFAEMQHAPYGPEYTAAVKRLDVWERENGMRWSPANIVPLNEHHLPLSVAIVIAALLPIGWKLRRGLRTLNVSNVSAGRRDSWWPWAVAAISALGCAGIGTVWVRSYQKPVTFRVCALSGVHTLVVNRGQAKLAIPPPATSEQGRTAAFAAAERLNDKDINWILYPSDAIPSPRGRSIPKMAIQAAVKRDTPAALLADVQNADALPATLRALEDPQRFLAAHVVMTERQFAERRFPVSVSGSRSSGAQYNGVSPSSIRWSGNRYNALVLSLTPAQQHPKQIMQGVDVGVAAGQQQLAVDFWHARYDRQLQPRSIWPVALAAFLFPLAWVVFAWRRHRKRRYRPEFCRACLYDLTGNTSGTCPECGTAVVGFSPAIRV